MNLFILKLKWNKPNAELVSFEVPKKKLTYEAALVPKMSSWLEVYPGDTRRQGREVYPLDPPEILAESYPSRSWEHVDPG